jgi:uncharacterized protein YeaO (DUF488 family)
MNKPRTDAETSEQLIDAYIQHNKRLSAELADKTAECENLATGVMNAMAELAVMTDARDSEQRWASQYKSERDKWTELAAKYAQEREHNANMALAYQSELKSEREKVAKLRDALVFYAGNFPNDDLGDWQQRICEDEGDKARQSLDSTK